MSEMGVLDLSGYGQTPQQARPACPPGTRAVVSPYTGRQICAVVGQPQGSQQTFSAMISALRQNPQLKGPSQALKQVHRGGPTGAAAAMAMSAKARLTGERQRTATMSPLIQRWTGIKSTVDESQAGRMAQKDYTPAAVTAGKGWMPGCKLVCPSPGASSQKSVPTMGVRVKVQQAQPAAQSMLRTALPK